MLSVVKLWNLSNLSGSTRLAGDLWRANRRREPGPEKYRLLDLKRRRAQIHARRVLELSD
jgi:hypothetical protein